MPEGGEGRWAPCLRARSSPAVFLPLPLKHRVPQECPSAPPSLDSCSALPSFPFPRLKEPCPRQPQYPSTAKRPHTWIVERRPPPCPAPTRGGGHSVGITKPRGRPKPPRFSSLAKIPVPTPSSLSFRGNPLCPLETSSVLSSSAALRRCFSLNPIMVSILNCAARPQAATLQLEPQHPGATGWSRFA